MLSGPCRLLLIEVAIAGDTALRCQTEIALAKIALAKRATYTPTAAGQRI